MTGNAAKRWANVRKCWSARTVVGHEDGDLPAVLDRLERGPERDLRLAVADVAHDEPVHRPAGLHVAPSPRRPRAAGRRVSSYGKDASISCCQGVSGANAWPSRRGPRRVQGEELLGQVGDGLADPVLGARPLAAAEPRQRRALAAGVAGDPVDLLDRDEDPVRRRRR